MRGEASNSSGSARELRCPRCGYDQAGIAATWSGQCPLRGVCSECGLLFEWADVFVPPRCAGLVEHARGVRQWAWWGLRTFLGVWRAKRFWTRVKLEHPVRLWKGMLWLVLAAAVMYLGVPLAWRGTALLMQFATGVPRVVDRAEEWQWLKSWEWMQWALPWHWDVLGRNAYADPELLSRVWNRVAGLDYPWWFLPLVAMCSASPAMFVLAPWTRARAKVELRHVGRWWLYGQGWVIVVFAWMIVVAMLTAVQDGLEALLPQYGWAGPGVRPEWKWTGVIRACHQWLSVAAWPMRSEVVMPLVWFGWLCWWNWNALKRGMRLDAIAFRVWWVLMVPTVLVGVLVAVVGVIVLGVLVPGVG